MAWHNLDGGSYGLTLTDGYLGTHTGLFSAGDLDGRAPPTNRRQTSIARRIRGATLYAYNRPGTTQLDESLRDLEIAYLMYEAIKGLNIPEARRSLVERPNPVHVWVLGGRNWLGEAPKSIRAISEGDHSPEYRILVTGRGLDVNGRLSMGDFPAWLRRAGMAKKKRHLDHSSFKDGAKEILLEMNRFYQKHRQAPSAVLEGGEIPFTFCGDRNP